MAIVYQKDKRSGITYAYESISFWDKEKKQSRSKRTLLGRVVGETKNIIPTDGRGRKKKEESLPLKKGRPAFTKTARYFYGATYLFDQIGERLGIAKDLQQCFPKHYQQIQSIVYYLIMEDKTPLYRFERWGTHHQHPCGQNISSQRSSELFASITEEAKQSFFRLQGARRVEQEFWAYDITSISSYSECLRQVQYGHSKEDPSLPQLNLALVFGEESRLPFYYRVLAGNIPDSKTVAHLLNSLDALGFSKVKLVMDRGFYSEANINALFKEHRKFLISVKLSLSFVRTALDKVYEEFRSFERYSENYDLYYNTVSIQWNYQQERSYKKAALTNTKRAYIHYYFSLDKAAEDEKTFDRQLVALRQELLSGNRLPKHEQLYQKYFEVTSTPKRGIKVRIKEEVIAHAKRYYGFFALFTNQAMSAITALELYRNKDLVEKAFGDLKERLNVRRTLVSSEQSLDGKLFVQFVALIYLSYIKKKMHENNMFKQYTLQEMLDKLDVIECFHAVGHEPCVGEVLEKQKLIYTNLGFSPPSSL